MYWRKIISSVRLNGNITKEAFHFEEVLFYDHLILLNWYNNKHDFINVGKGISEKELKVSETSPELPDIYRTENHIRERQRLRWWIIGKIPFDSG